MKEELDNYFLGELTDTEKNALFDKIESDEECKSEFIEMQNTVTLTQLLPQKDDNEFSSQMIGELFATVEKRRLRRTLWNVTKYAAVVALLIVNGWLVKEKVIAPAEVITYTTIEVPKGQRVSMTLQDGTEAWLSPRSVLRIPNQFNTKERFLELDGEGYFSVTKDEKRPFIVQTGQHRVKVLGTRFNVFAYSESNRFETDLLEGKVEVSDRFKPENMVSLTPGEKVTFMDNRLVKSISYFNNEDYLKNGVFSFSNKPFGEILEYLTLWYDIRFEIKDSAKKELLVSGKFRQSDEVKNILKALQGVHPFKYKEITEQKIEIY